MQANPRSIDALFNSQLRYVVPMFQRLYVWQEYPQWRTLWEDVAEKAKLQLEGRKTNPHYLGALIIEGVRPSSPREVKRFLIIDGQQRLTTLQLLLCAFRDIARQKDWKNLDRTISRYLENADPDVMERPDEEVFKLWPTKLNRDIFSGILRCGSRSKVEATYPLVYIGRKRKPEPRSALVEAYLYFSREIETWLSIDAELGKPPEDRAFSLLQSLQQDFCVVEIALSEGDDSQEIFYSLNSQGRPLSQSDLLRSLIFMRAEADKINRDEIFDHYWGKFETDFWSADIKRGGRSYSRLDLGLRLFLMGKTGELVDARRVNEEYKKWISVEPPRYPTVREELADLLRYGEEYKSFDTAPLYNLPCTDIRRIISDCDVSTALPLILFLNLDADVSESDRRQCLLDIESFIIRRIIIGDENKEYNKLFVEIIGEIRKFGGAELVAALRRKLSTGGGTTRRWPNDSVVTEALIQREIYKNLRQPALRLILERIELELRNKKSENLDIPGGLQIEHVMPQKWSQYWPLEGKMIPLNLVQYPFLARDEFESLAQPIRHRNSLIQTIGNLTLVNKYLNPAASDGGFDAKLFEYKNSLLRLNRYFDNEEAWDEQAITRRGTKIAELVCQVWQCPPPQ